MAHEPHEKSTITRAHHTTIDTSGDRTHGLIEEFIWKSPVHDARTIVRGKTMSEDDELAEIRRRKMEMLMRQAGQPARPQVVEPLANGQVNVLTDATFWQTIQQTKIALVDFFGVWCRPCQALAPIMAELARHYEGKVFFGKIDIDRNPRTTQRFNVQSVPIIYVFENGRPLTSILGLRQYSDYDSIIRQLLARHGVE